MALLLGRQLRTNEHVHHIDGNRLNNLPSNLQLLTNRVHTSRSIRRRGLVAYCQRCRLAFVRKQKRGGKARRFCSIRCAVTGRTRGAHGRFA